MKRSLRAKDSGLASIEFALVYLLILSLLTLSVPLVIALQERVRLERVAGHTARFATATPERPRFGSEKRRPTREEVQAEALRTYREITHMPVSESELPVTVMWDRDPEPAHPGENVTIEIKRTVGLGPIGALMDIIGATTSSSIDMTVTAVGRQE